MLLAIDCGNTNTVFSIWDGGKFLCTLRTSTHHARTADAYFTWYSTLVKHYGIQVDITDVIISSTVPRVVFNLRVFTDRFFGWRRRRGGTVGAWGRSVPTGRRTAHAGGARPAGQYRGGV